MASPGPEAAVMSSCNDSLGSPGRCAGLCVRTSRSRRPAPHRTPKSPPKTETEAGTETKSETETETETKTGTETRTESDTDPDAATVLRLFAVAAAEPAMIEEMILDDHDFDRVSKMQEGRLDEVPFSVLLCVFARASRSATLEISRPPWSKEIMLAEGVPVQCTSNLVGETLSRFLIGAGRLDERTAEKLFAESCTRGVRFGEVLVEKNLMTPEDLRKARQENLARKLLDCFSWHSGTFHLRDLPVDVDTSLHVNVPQLIVLGVTRFATQAQVDGLIGPLIGKPLALNIGSFFEVDEVRLPEHQRRLVESLEPGCKRIDELAAETGLSFPEVTRLLYALALIGVVLPEDQLPAPKFNEGSHGSPPIEPPSVAPAEEEVTVRGAGPRNELMRLALTYRRYDPFELLGVDPDRLVMQLDDRFLAFAEKYGPWNHEGNLADEAREVFLAGARAYGELKDPQRRRQLVAERSGIPVGSGRKAKRPTSGSQVLDSDVQFKKGKFLMARGDYRGAVAQLTYASHIDPQNSTYRAELALCRFLCDPKSKSQQALDELHELLRINPRCGLAHFNMGEVLRHMGRLDDAQKAYERAIKPMAPDRRPIDALKAMLKERKATG